MIIPKAPRWFVKKLRELDSRLEVFFHPRKLQWEIAQLVPYAVDYGTWNGMRFIRTEKIRHKVMNIPQLGSRVFNWIRQNDISKHNNFVDFSKALNLETYQQYKETQDHRRNQPDRPEKRLGLLRGR